jgi:hypothetical protein
MSALMRSAILVLLVASIQFVTSGCESVGRQSAEELGTKVVEASRNLQAMTNQFGQIVADYYGGTEAQKARAKAILEGVLGPLGKHDPVLAVTVSVEGINSSDGIVIDVWPMAGADIDAVRALAKQNVNNFKAEPINTPAPSPRDYASVSNAVSTPASIYVSTAMGLTVPGQSTTLAACNDGLAKCGVVSDDDNTKITNSIACANGRKCYAAEATKELVNAIMAPFSNQPSLPGPGTLTRTIGGGTYVVVLMPSKQLEQVKARVKMNVWLAYGSEPQTRIGAFAQNPQVIIVDDMLRNRVTTSSVGYPELCFYFIPLRIDDVMTSKEPAKK